MRKSLKPFVAVAMGAALVTGLAACDALPPIEIPSELPDISIPPIPTGDPVPGPIVTETVTADPAPAPIVTVTVTEDGVPGPQPTETVTAEPGPQPTITVTADPDDPNPVPTVTVTVTSNVTATPSPEPSPSVTPTPMPSPEVDPPVDVEDDPTKWWPWILLGLIVAGLLAWWWSTAASRSNGKRRLAAAGAKMAWAEESLAPHVLGQASAAEELAAWQASRQTLDELDRELFTQSTSAPTQALRTAAVQGRAVLGELRAALDAETSLGAKPDADAVRASRGRVDAARAQVRAWVAAADS